MMSKPPGEQDNRWTRYGSPGWRAYRGQRSCRAMDAIAAHAMDLRIQEC